MVNDLLNISQVQIQYLLLKKKLSRLTFINKITVKTLLFNFFKFWMLPEIKGLSFILQQPAVISSSYPILFSLFFCLSHIVLCCCWFLVFVSWRKTSSQEKPSLMLGYIDRDTLAGRQGSFPTLLWVTGKNEPGSPKRPAGSQMSGRIRVMGRQRDRGGTEHPQMCNTRLGELFQFLEESPWVSQLLEESPGSVALED